MYLRALIHLKRSVDKVGPCITKYAAVIQQPRQAAHCICTPAKAEKIQFITEGVVLNDKAIAILDVFIDSLAKGPGREFVVIGAQTPAIKNHLLHPVLAFGADGPGQFENICRKILLEVFIFNPLFRYFTQE